MFVFFLVNTDSLAKSMQTHYSILVPCHTHSSIMLTPLLRPVKYTAKWKSMYVWLHFREEIFVIFLGNIGMVVFKGRNFRNIF